MKILLSIPIIIFTFTIGIIFEANNSGEDFRSIVFQYLFISACSLSVASFLVMVFHIFKKLNNLAFCLITIVFLSSYIGFAYYLK